MQKKAINSLLIILVLFTCGNAPIQSKICEITFQHKGSAQSLERKMKQKSKLKYSKSKPKLNCYQIGLEHDEDKKPIEGKPIYACCQSI
ncbi:hypothetical protein [Prochlorococcus marinus]|uniref:hypothetical protein n=1 Tax=Prochlorococcus marinus TaxID=1219 RepID=UPI0005673AF4|nr:hypothetical protein [Prochlorococcus marinus]